MLGLSSYGERVVDMELISKQKEFGRFLTEAEVAKTAWQVKDKIYDILEGLQSLC